MYNCHFINASSEKVWLTTFVNASAVFDCTAVTTCYAIYLKLIISSVERLLQHLQLNTTGAALSAS